MTQDPAHRLARLSARLFNSPLLVTPDVAETIASNLAERLGVEPLATPSLVVKAGPFDDDGDDDGPGYSVESGIATIAVRGELVNRGSWLNSASGMTSYEALTSTLRKAEADFRVKGILLDMDSPGGEAAGAMETADVVRAVSKNKKVVAYVNSLAASAAYAIAAAASEIVVTPSANVGSIGVVYLHLDRSAAIAARGVKPTLIHAGAFKVDGNSMQPLEPEARARIQSAIDDVYALFTDSVGKHRPELGVEGARATEASLFMGRKAVVSGLADKVGSVETALKSLPRSSPFAQMRTSRGENMDPIHTQAALDAAVANAVAAARRDAETAHALALTQARAESAAAERTRIKAILDGDAAKGRGALARHFALSTDMSPEAAAAALAAAAPEVANPSRLSQTPNPHLAPGGSQRSENPQAGIDAGWSTLAANLNKEAGLKA